MINLKIFIPTLFLIITPLILFSQERTESDIFKNTIKKKALEFKSDNFNKAHIFFNAKNWDSTLVYSMKQLNFKKSGEIADFCHYFRGYCFREKKIFKEAQFELKQVKNSFIFYPLVIKNLGEISLALREFKKAIEFFKKIDTLPLANEQGFKLSSIYENTGISYLHLNDYKKAEEYLSKSKKLRENENDTIALITLYTNIASLYYNQYKDFQAIPYFEKAYVLSKKIEDFDSKRTSSKNMAVLEENRGNYKQALTYRKEAEQWNDSLNNQNKVWAVADFEKKFAVAQKQKQIKVLEVENELKNNQRNWSFFSALSLLILLTIGVYLYAQKVKNAKTILLQKNKLDELNTTKDQLFSIVSHDLRSSVNALKNSNSKLLATLESKNYEELNQLIVQNSGIANGTYSLLDNLLHWAMLQTKQLYFSQESVHLFSIIQQIEYNYKPLLLEKNIHFENLVAKSCFIYVDLDSLKIVLRNLLDNAIKFSNENGEISFSTAETQNGYWDLIIKDNGIGMTQNTIDTLVCDSELLTKKNNSEIIGTGLGFQLCKQMIRKNNGKLAIESQINIGTTITISFPKTVQNG